MSLVRQIAGLKEEHAELQTTSNILQTLQQQLTEAQTRVKVLEDKCKNAWHEQGEVKSKQKRRSRCGIRPIALGMMRR